jgi:hypothetical protein
MACYGDSFTLLLLCLWGSMMLYVNFNMFGGLVRPYKQVSAVFKKHYCLIVLLFRLSLHVFVFSLILFLVAHGFSIIYLTPKIEAVRFPETSVNFYRSYMDGFLSQQTFHPCINTANMAARRSIALLWRHSLCCTELTPRS